MGSALEGVKVLLIDDDLLTLEMFEYAVAQNQADVKKASSVAEAFEILQWWIPDVLVSDIGMPGEDGLSLIRRLRMNEAHHPIQIIAATGYASYIDREKLLNEGCSEILSKPIDPSMLVSTIQNLMNRTR